MHPTETTKKDEAYSSWLYCFKCDNVRASHFDLVIDCPSCGAEEAEASGFDLRCSMSLVGLLRVWRSTSTWVTCRACDRELISERSMPDLVRLSPAEAGASLKRRLSPIANCS